MAVYSDDVEVSGMKPYYQDKSATIYNASCLDALPCLAENSVDSIVTDPPYELGFMGKSWDRSGIAYNVEVWREALRVLKPGGHLLAFGGSRTYHRLACAIEDAGFEIRDQIQWIYGSGFPKSLDVSKAIDTTTGVERLAMLVPTKDGNAATRSTAATDMQSGFRDVSKPQTESARQWQGWGTALKPAHEPLVLARKPLIGTVAENVLQHGTGGLNVDGCRIETSRADQEYISERIGGFNQTRSIGGNGKYQGGEIMDRTAYDAAKGRWPANVIHDGSDEVLAGFPYSVCGTNVVNGTENCPAGTVMPSYGDEGSARFFYCAKASQAERNAGLSDLPQRSAGEVTDRKDGSDGLNSPRAGAGRTGGSRNHHPTVKPLALMLYLVKLITPPGGIVLDPFLGSGSTLLAAKQLGHKNIGIEQAEEYCAIAQQRLLNLPEPLIYAAPEPAKPPRPIEQPEPLFNV